ncbi:MAG: hypothetical protein IPJ20_23955 [Flammeovirgaceae bacterium]|nr:hypothetical protein [Flammeovirgaceae bacterium]
MQTIRNWRAKLSPVFGVIILGVFFYWIWLYRDIILDTFRKIELVQLVALVALIMLSSILTVWALVVLVQDKGYTAFGFADGYHSLNLSQLASMIPGGIWGDAGLLVFCGQKAYRKLKRCNNLIKYNYHVICLCHGWHLRVDYHSGVGICGHLSFAFLFLIFGRNWLDGIRHKFYPESSRLPSALALLKSLFLGIMVWIIISSCFAWLLYTGNGTGSIPFGRLSVHMPQGIWAATLAYLSHQALA